MDWKKYLIEHKDQQFTVYLIRVEVSEKEKPFGIHLDESSNYGYLDEKCEYDETEDIKNGFIFMNLEEAVRKMNLMFHLLQNHLTFNVSVTYSVEEWRTEDLSKCNAKQLKKMSLTELVCGDFLKEGEASRSFGYNFKDLTGCILVKWKWVNYIQCTRKFLGLEVVSYKDDVHDERLLVVSSDETYENRSLILKHDDRYLGYANGDINDIVEENLMEEYWNWVNPDDISLYFKKNEDVMIFDDLSIML